MNRNIKIVAGVAFAIALALSAPQAYAQSSSTGSVLGSTVTNLLQGVLSKTDLTVDDICGQWTANGSAVSFKSDNFLKKAGGLAAAGALESKINPYYEKLGLNNAVLTIKDDATFTLKASKLSLSGTIENGEEKGSFVFNFKAFGKISFGSVTTYVNKSGNHMDVMFDATKLKSLVSGIASITGINIAKTFASILDSYDGLCVGFSMNKTGSVTSTKASSSSSSSLGTVLGNILGGGSSKSSTSKESAAPASTTTNSSEPTPAKESDTTSKSKSGSSAANALLNVLKNKNSENKNSGK